MKRPSSPSSPPVLLSSSPPISSYRAFVWGLCAPFKGLHALFTIPGNLKWLLIPFLIFLILWSASLYGIYHGLDTVLILLPESLTFSSPFLKILLWILLSLFSSYLFLFVLRFLFAPFFALIAENSCQHFGLNLHLPQGLFPWLAFQWRMLVSTVWDTVFLLFLSFISLFFFTFFFPMGFLVSYFVALALVFEANAYTYECLNMNFKERWHCFYAQRWIHGGVALSLMGLLFFFPWLGLLFFASLVAISGQLLQKGGAWKGQGHAFRERPDVKRKTKEHKT